VGLLGGVERQCLFEVGLGSSQLAELIQDKSEILVPPTTATCVAHLQAEAEELLSQRAGRL
jgi:hypothetical protein